METIFSAAGAVAAVGWLLLILVMTFMLGPIGLLFYFAIRTATTRKMELGGA